jgi:hypothetical protein
MNRTVKDIVIEYLKANGYDGLCSSDCGCKIDDLIPCSGYGSPDMCEPGVKEDCGKCEEQCGSEEFCISTKPCL